MFELVDMLVYSLAANIKYKQQNIHNLLPNTFSAYSEQHVNDFTIIIISLHLDKENKNIRLMT